MPFGANDGQRINIRMSDMIRTRTEYGGGTDEWYGSGNITSIGTYSDVTRQSGGFKLSSMSAVLPYTDSNYDGADTGIYSLYNKLDGVYGSSGSMYENPVIYNYMNSRYRSGSNAAPSNIDAQFSNGEMKFGNMVGVGNSCLTTDNVGQSRGVTNRSDGYPYTKQIQGFHQRDQATSGGVGGIGMSPGASVNSAGNKVGTSPNDATGAANIGYSVYCTSYTNAWTHCKLNTKLCSGDRVIVVAHGGGGDMYTFSTTDPIYLRNESTGGSVAVSALVQTIMAPHKNTTGQDDNMAIYSAICTGDGATVVGVNPYHSSAQPYIFHIFCIKGPSTYIDGVTNATTKYTSSSADSTIGTNLFGIPAPDAMNRSQRFYIGISSSPFYNNRLLLNNSTVINTSTGEFDRAAGFGTTATEGYNSYYHEGGTIQQFGVHYPRATYGGIQGAFFTSVCDYTGGTRGSQSSGKFSINYNNIQGFYTPQFAYCRPFQDSRVLLIRGRRGNGLNTP